MLAYCLMDTELIIALYTAPHSSTLAWKIPCMEEPGGLQSMGSLRVDFTFTHWRRKWQPTPVFLPGKSQGRWILVGCRLWGCKESDMTEVTQQQHSIFNVFSHNQPAFYLYSFVAVTYTFLKSVLNFHVFEKVL